MEIGEGWAYTIHNTDNSKVCACSPSNHSLQFLLSVQCTGSIPNVTTCILQWNKQCQRDCNVSLLMYHFTCSFLLQVTIGCNWNNFYGLLQMIIQTKIMDVILFICSMKTWQNDPICWAIRRYQRQSIYPSFSMLTHVIDIGIRHMSIIMHGCKFLQVTASNKSAGIETHDCLCHIEHTHI